MRITGDAILASALEAITGERADGNDATDDLDVLARRSRHVIDSANLSTDVLGERATAYCVTVTNGSNSFLWGPGGDVFDPLVEEVLDPNTQAVSDSLTRAARHDVLPPSDVAYWTWQDGDYERFVTPGGRLTPLQEWLNHDWLGVGGWPRLLYWTRRVNEKNQSLFQFAPTAQEDYTLNLYAQVPALEQVERGKTYDLPRGLAAYLIQLIAIDGCQPFNFTPRPEMHAALKAAERGLGKVRNRFVARANSPDWLDLDGRGGRHVWHP